MKKLILFSIVLVFLVIPIFSQSGYQMLEVDGLRVHVNEIRFAQGYSDSSTIGSISVDQDINLTDIPSDVFNEDTVIRLEFGESELMFDTIDIWLDSSVGIKGHTYFEADNVHVYTSAAGIKTLAGSTWSEPSDYGYHTNDYLYYPGDGDGGEVSETTFLQAMTTFTGDVPLNISLLVDTFQVAYYWDGDDNTRHGFVKTVPISNNASAFPSGTAVIGITYLPLYLSVNQTLTSETYVVAEDSSYLTPENGEFYNEKYTMNMTLVFDEDDDTFFIGRTANWDGLYTSFRLPQFVTGATASGSAYELDLENYDEGEGGWTDNSTITGFSRLAVDGTGTFTFTDSANQTHSLYCVRVK